MEGSPGIQVAQGDDFTVIRLAGDLDIVTADDVWRVASSNVAAAEVLVLDCLGVRFLDSSGISTLLRIRNSCGHAGTILELHGLQPQPRRAIELTGVAAHLGLANDTGPSSGSQLGVQARGVRRPVGDVAPAGRRPL